MKIRQVGVEMFHVDGQRQTDRQTDNQTDRYDDTSSRFSQFCKRA